MYHPHSMSFNTNQKALLSLFFLGIVFCSSIFAQEQIKTRSFSGAITVTNNGISLLPTFTLGKPAAIFDFAVKSKKWSFEPQLRFSLEGKPWTFVFWGRYKVIDEAKFQLTVGAHPAIAFKEENMLNMLGTPKSVITAYRYAATEIVPNWKIKKNVSVGLYYLNTHGIDEGTTHNTHFVTLNSTLSKIKIVPNTYLKFQPQIYYLKMDNKQGYYASSTFTLNHAKSPFSISSILNKKIHTNLSGDDFIWNVSLVYSF